MLEDVDVVIQVRKFVTAHHESKSPTTSRMGVGHIHQELIE